jgi:hypothetical protein
VWGKRGREGMGEDDDFEAENVEEIDENVSEEERTTTRMRVRMARAGVTLVRRVV